MYMSSTFRSTLPPIEEEYGSRPRRWMLYDQLESWLVEHTPEWLFHWGRRVFVFLLGEARTFNLGKGEFTVPSHMMSDLRSQGKETAGSVAVGLTKRKQYVGRFLVVSVVPGGKGRQPDDERDECGDGNQGSEDKEDGDEGYEDEESVGDQVEE
ncbi:hypothetical protein TREMEDRAFT_66478 [Tremella mesenterica DSM 1558]|uniref:uncharacterized protein n=1 Tax=Tremella mesenterica (strain ATCC 24925 / CBS 8224 / DSM 1558 / NBRC 9311 / NRRL Y-6157 / RJB 2259-6 / UBC 559-6) TaxID=578456 RepID=UPI00032C2359|nr:uncharacterized protein TREMEDRAFT_66478 [Tremella mesenterica DSM 1558]EIW65565.1 hypothetical protein TREMEDRAFT_66478 [Tremella mesenterica DSM 1558]